MNSNATYASTEAGLSSNASPLGEVAELLGHRYLDILSGVTQELSGKSDEDGAPTLTEHITNFHRDLEGLLQLSARFSRHPVVHQLLIECLEVRDEFSAFLHGLSRLLVQANDDNRLESEKRDLEQRNQRIAAKLGLVFQLAGRLEAINAPVSEAA